MSIFLRRNLSQISGLWSRLSPVSGSSIGSGSSSGFVRFCSSGDPSKKIARPEEGFGYRAKKEDATKGKGPVSWVNLGVTGVVVLSMVSLFWLG
jgi:hypothetical protein